jgi:hypothetical protein
LYFQRYLQNIIVQEIALSFNTKKVHSHQLRQLTHYARMNVIQAYVEQSWTTSSLRSTGSSTVLQDRTADSNATQDMVTFQRCRVFCEVKCPLNELVHHLKSSIAYLDKTKKYLYDYGLNRALAPVKR